MKNKNLYKRALVIAVPMMIQNGITNMVSLVDNVMVGSLGTEAITAVSVIGQLIFVFNLSIFGGFAGAGIFGAQYYGQKNKDGFLNAVRMKLWIGAACLILGLAAFIFGGNFLIGMYMRGESAAVNMGQTMSFARQYLNIMLLGLPPFVITQVYATSLRETGESFTPMVSGVASVVIDVVFNYLLIYGKLGFPKLGVSGAAIATVMARVVEMLIVIIATYSRKEKHPFLQGVYTRIRVPWSTAVKFIKKSAPMFANELLWAGACAGAIQVYSARGLEIVAGMNISNAICNTMNTVYVSLGSAIGIVIGHILGTSQFERAKKDAITLTYFTAAISLILTVIMIPIAGFFPKLYNTTEYVRSLAQSLILISAFLFPVYGALNAIYFTLRSGGKMLITFLFDGGFSWLVAMPIAIVLCNFTSLNILTIFALVQSAEILKFIAGYILIKKGAWTSNLTEEVG